MQVSVKHARNDVCLAVAGVGSTEASIALIPAHYDEGHHVTVKHIGCNDSILQIVGFKDYLAVLYGDGLLSIYRTTISGVVVDEDPESKNFGSVSVCKTEDVYVKCELILQYSHLKPNGEFKTITKIGTWEDGESEGIAFGYVSYEGKLHILSMDIVRKDIELKEYESVATQRRTFLSQEEKTAALWIIEDDVDGKGREIQKITKIEVKSKSTKTPVKFQRSRRSTSTAIDGEKKDALASVISMCRNADDYFMMSDIATCKMKDVVVPVVDRGLEFSHVYRDDQGELCLKKSRVVRGMASVTNPVFIGDGWATVSAVTESGEPKILCWRHGQTETMYVVNCDLGTPLAEKLTSVDNLVVTSNGTYTDFTGTTSNTDLYKVVSQYCDGSIWFDGFEKQVAFLNE